MSDLFTDETESKGLPGNLNVLTILTFIWSSIEFLGGIWKYINAEKQITSMEATLNDPHLPAWAKNMTIVGLERV